MVNVHSHLVSLIIHYVPLIIEAEQVLSIETCCIPLNQSVFDTRLRFSLYKSFSLLVHMTNLFLVSESTHTVQYAKLMVRFLQWNLYNTIG